MRPPWMPAPGPATFRAVAALCACAAAAPCSDNDWRTGFSVCAEAPDGGMRRSVFAYAPEGVCDPSDPESRPLPAPLLGEPCHALCAAGTREYADVQQTGEGPARLKLRCKECTAGHYSLGGGILVDGGDSDWAKPWPTNIQSYCYYRDENWEWQRGVGSPRYCLLHLGSSAADQPGHLVAETRPATWDEQLADVDLNLPMVLPGGDELGCTPFDSGFSFNGAALLVLRGTCTFQEKAANAQQAGAGAVVVYNNIPNDGYFYPAAADMEHAPQLPFFMITYEDGIEWREALLEADEALNLHVPSTHCRESAREALPQNYFDNSSDEELQNEMWGSNGGRGLGCREWTAEPGGSYLHSGGNLHFHDIFSFLEFEALFVRDGYISFQYSVGAEDIYDGLTFLVDEVPVLEASRVPPYSTLTHNVSRGPHKFVWVYSKDGVGTVREDRARIQMLEVVGTSHADSECRKCASGAGPLVSRSQCGRCGWSSYLSTDAAEGGEATPCVSCPAGKWSLPGAFGQGSCQPRRACGRTDLEIVYTAVKNLTGGSSQVLPGRHCYAGQTLVQYRMKEPSICDPALPHEPLPPDRFEACPPCEPHMWRPAGGECEAEFLSCPDGQSAFRELVVSRWQTWPANVSTEIEGGLGIGNASEDAFGRAWQLDPEGRTAVVGTAFMNEADVDLAASSGVHVAASLLHLDVALGAPGALRFAFVMLPANHWASPASLLVDGAPAKGLTVSTNQGSSAPLKALLQLAAGRHRITWQWQYPSDHIASEGLAESSGLRLLNITVANAQGAPPARCGVCPSGQQFVANSSACQPCPPGHSSTDYSLGFGEGALTSTCSVCPVGRAAVEGQAECVFCGQGLHSHPGASRCAPAAQVSTGGLADSLSWDMESLQFSWNRVVSALARGNSLAFPPVAVEDRMFYISPFETLTHPGEQYQAEEDGIAEAYWWEEVRPLGKNSLGAMSGAFTCVQSDFSAIGARLDAYEPVVQEDGPIGIAAVFSGPCDADAVGEGASSRVRRARLFFRCDLDAELPAAAGGGSAGGAVHMPDLSFLDASATAGAWNCDDMAVEWRTRAACPVCRESDWVRVQEEGYCEPGVGREVTYTSTHPCIPGAPQPPSEWESCGGISTLAAVVIVSGAILPLLLFCCSMVYVMILRRRYKKYMQLEPRAGPVLGRNGPEPAVVGQPPAAV